MLNLCECLNIEKWPELQDFISKGSREKKWVLKPSEPGTSTVLEIFLFKESHRRYAAEFWSEIIATQMGKIMGISVPEAICAKDGNTYGVLLTFFLKIVDRNIAQELVEGGDLIVAIDDSFERKKGEKHNIYIAEQVFKRHKKEAIFNDFLQLLVFDSVIGNTDRHQENWGLIVDHQAQTIRLAPAYDNSDCFGREIIEENIQGFLDDTEKLRHYLLRGQPHIRWSDDGVTLHKLSHIDFLKKMVDKWPIVRDYINKQTTFSDQQVKEMLDKVFSIKIENPKYKLNEKRRVFIEKIIIGRRDLIKAIFGLN